MKTKILIIVLARMVMSLSNPAVAQQVSSSVPAGAQQSDTSITISWHNTSTFEAEASRMMEAPAFNDLLPADSSGYRMLMKLEDSSGDDHCKEEKLDFSSACASDYKFIHKPVTIQ